MENFNSKKSKALNIAVRSALQSTMKSQHGCVLVLNGKPISSGVNHLRGTIHGQSMISCHAEIHAMHKAAKVVLGQMEQDRIVGC